MALVRDLIVYGSLLRNDDGKQHFLLQDAEYRGEVSLEGRLFAVASYPGVVLERGCVVRGELYRLSNTELTLRNVDEYEECSSTFPEPHEYRRIVTTAKTDNGEQVEAWLYLYNRSTAGLLAIPSGDYRQFLRELR